MKLPEEVRESRKQSLVKGLDDLDDVEIAITWSKEGKRIGRDPKDYDDVTLDLDSAHTFRVTGGFGFDLAALPEVGNSPARLELEAKYENVSDDEVRNDNRLVATLSYIQKMSESSSASLSLIYANKPELLGEVNQEFSAHLGLKFKMDTKDGS